MVTLNPVTLEQLTDAGFKEMAYFPDYYGKIQGERSTVYKPKDDGTYTIFFDGTSLSGRDLFSSKEKGTAQ